MPSANQQAKVQKAAEFQKKFMGTSSAIVTHYDKISVEKITDLRKKLRDADIHFNVIKNSIARRAVEGTPLESLKDSFQGPMALAYTDQDAVAMAKALVDFSKDEENLKILAGALEGKLLKKEEVAALASLPSREVLLARLVGSLQSPYAGLVYTLSGVLRKLVYALDAVRRKKEEEQGTK